MTDPFSDTNPIESAITAAREAARRKDYSAALCSLQGVSDQPYLPDKYFLLKARLIQSSDGAKYSLDDSRVALERALALSPDNAEILSELGFFHSRVAPDKYKGQDYFRRALDRLRFFYKETICGLVDEMWRESVEPDNIIEEEIAKLRKDIQKEIET